MFQPKRPRQPRLSLPRLGGESSEIERAASVEKEREQGGKQASSSWFAVDIFAAGSLKLGLPL